MLVLTKVDEEELEEENGEACSEEENDSPGATWRALFNRDVEEE